MRVVALLVCVCFPFPVFAAQADRAADAVSSVPAYHVDTWTTDNGLPQNSVYSITQTHDGYLWFTTLDGLVRYDGVRFKIFNKGNTKGIDSDRFTSLFEDPSGNLWIATEDSGLTLYRDGTFKTYTTHNGLPSNRISSVQLNPQGILTILTFGGIVQWRGENLTPYQPLAGENSSDVIREQIGFIKWDSGGALWYSSQRGLCRFKDGHLTIYAKREGITSDKLSGLYEDREGTIWIRSADAGTFRFKDGSFSHFSDKDALLYQDRSGNLWKKSDAGLAVMKDGKATPLAIAGWRPNSLITAIYEDREGNLWLGTLNRGLNRLTRQEFVFYGKEDGLGFENVASIYEDNAGSIWIGGGGGLTRFRDGVFRAFSRLQGWPNTGAISFYEDRSGRLWMGIWGSAFYFKDDKFTEFFRPHAAIRAILEDEEGALWFGSTWGLFRFADGKMVRYTTADGLAGDDVKAILADRVGGLWVATYGGLSRWHNGSFVSYTEADGLPSNRVRSLYLTEDGVLWIGTYDGGLARFKDGKFTRYTSEEGLFNNGVFQILEDGRGSFWMSCNVGIFRVSRQQLNDFAEGKIKRIVSVSYGKRNGLLNTECNGGQQPAGVKTRDGKMWFPTQGGVAVIDPEHGSFNPYPPPVVIEEVVLDDKPVDFRQGVELQPGEDNFEIRYTGLSFTTPEHVRFKFKLAGLDEDWVDASTRRVAFYQHIPPGEYTFEVIAANRDGIWNAQGAQVHIIVRPPFWRTWWFMALAVVTIGTGGVAAYRHRISRLYRERAVREAFSQQLIESQERERKRIAAELHDSLGQNLLIIKNRAIFGALKTEEGVRAKAQFDEITDSATRAIEEVREIAYNLRPYHLDRLGLSTTIRAMVEELGDASGIHFTSEIEPIDGLFTPEAEITLYRVLQEAVSNIVRHSRATEASVEAHMSDCALLLTVRDNGQGLNAKAATNEPGRGGFGLVGIAERVRILGGTHTIRSAPGHGTALTISLELPTHERR